MREVFSKSEGSALKIVANTWATHTNPWSGMARLQVLKLRGVLEPWEVPNNVSYDYGREVSPILRVLLTYGALLPLALAGLLTGLRSWRRHVLLLVLLGVHVAALQAFIVLGRYRLVLMTPLIIYAAWGLVRFAGAARGRRRGAFVGAALAVVVLVLQQGLVPLAELRGAVYVPEYEMAARLYLQAGEPERSLAELERMKVRLAGTPAAAGVDAREGRLHLELAERASDRDVVRRHVERAEALLLEPDAKESSVLGALRLALGDRGAASVHFRRHLALEPDSPLRSDIEALIGDTE
jgi:hypothetical protein